MKKVTVNVTAEDIAQGERFCSDRCPVALAVRRATGQSVDVCDVGICWSPKEWLDLPNTVSAFIDNFDHLRRVYPIAFELEVPE